MVENHWLIRKDKGKGLSSRIEDGPKNSAQLHSGDNSHISSEEKSMNRMTLGVVALAAKSDFGKTEMVGDLHNQALEYVLTRMDRSRNADRSQVKGLVIEFIKRLPDGTFGKLSSKECAKLAEKILEKADLDGIADRFVWKPRPELSLSANRSISTLLKLIKSFIGTEITPENGKALLEDWQKKLKGKTLTSSDEVILGGTGSIARYSIAYWLISEVPASNECPAAADVFGGVVGGILGYGLGGPGVAIIGAVALGAVCSAWD
jgi:hypothetical protein